MIERDDVELADLWNGYQKEHPIEPTDLEKLRVENEKLKLSLMELAKAREVDKTEIQLALAELAGLIGGE